MRAFLGRTEQQTDSTTDTTVAAGDDDLPALELTGRLVRFTVRGDVVNWRGVEPPLFTRKRLLVLEGWEKGLLEFFWNLLSGHGLSEGRGDTDGDGVWRERGPLIHLEEGRGAKDDVTARVRDDVNGTSLLERDRVCEPANDDNLRLKYAVVYIIPVCTREPVQVDEEGQGLYI